MIKTYYVCGYGYNEDGSRKQFQGLIDVANPNSISIMNEIIRRFQFSPFRNRKEIIIEKINVL